MPTAGRSHRLFWIAGILLLAGSLLGANYVLNGAHPVSASKPEVEKPQTPYGIVALGFSDIEAGVASLYPVQQGRVVELAEEGRSVKKGDLLLRVDNRAAEYRLREAKADVAAAREMSRQAESVPQQYQEKLKQQELAIEANKNKRAIFEQEYKIKQKIFNEIRSTENEKILAEEKVKAQDAVIAAEEAKLRELKLIDPKVDVERARADLAAKEARLEQAKLALEECDLRAPSDGMVLRVLCHLHELLTTGAKAPAIQFAPNGPKIIRAEVLQEWASKVKVGQDVSIADDTFAGPTWTGKVKRISPWFAHKRSVIIEPFMFNDVRTLECLVEVTSEETPLRIGQRVRVTIQQDK